MISILDWYFKEAIKAIAAGNWEAADHFDRMMAKHAAKKEGHREWIRDENIH